MRPSSTLQHNIGEPQQSLLCLSVQLPPVVSAAPPSVSAAQGPLWEPPVAAWFLHSGWPGLHVRGSETSQRKRGIKGRMTGEMGLTTQWSLHTHLFEFLNFILCFQVAGIELENHLIICSERDSYCHLSALTLDRWSNPLNSFSPSSADSYFFSANRAAPLRAYALK